MEDKKFLRHLNSVNPLYPYMNRGLTTFFKPLDDIIGGFACGGLTTIAGLSGSRHDNFLYSMLVNWVKSELSLPLLYINLRGHRHSSAIMHAIALNFPHNELFKGDKWGRAEMSHYDALRELELSKKEESFRDFYIETFEYININTLQLQVRDYVRNKGVKVVVIDGFQSILGDVFHSTDKDRHHIAKSLKDLASCVNVPIIVNTTLFPNFEKDGYCGIRIPGLADFRCDTNSGDIDYYSDLVLGVHSPDVYGTQEDKKSIESNIIEVKVLKNMYGAENCTVKLHYDSNTRGVYSRLNRCCEVIKLNISNYQEYIPIRKMLLCIYNETEEWIEVITDTTKVFYIDCSANGLEKELIYELLPVLKNCSLVKYGGYFNERTKGAYSVNVKDWVYVITEDGDVMACFEQLYFETKKKNNYFNIFHLSQMIIENKDSFIETKTNSLINEVKQFSCDGWMLGVCHGISHWERVERNGLLLATDEVNTTVVRLFAYLHDKWRVDNGEDLEHGKRAAENLSALRATLLAWLTDEEFDLLCKACELHTVCHSTGNPTIDTCFDADRLDLMRVGIIPDPERMATERGAFYAANLEQFFTDTGRRYRDYPF